MKIENLKCEFLTNPIVIGSRYPRFSWIISTEEYNVVQTSYRIGIASDRQNLDEDNYDIWDSGIINSDECIEIKYEGLKLKSKNTYWWKVICKTNTGNELVSDIASFGMGMLLESDWKCGFIGLDAKHTIISEEAGEKAGAPSPFLRKTFKVDKNIKSAKVFATAFGIYELRLNGKKVGMYELAPGWTDYDKSLQYQGYDVTHMLNIGENCIGAILGDGWFTGNVAIVERKQYGDYPLGVKMHLHIEYNDGSSDLVITNKEWKGSTGPILYNDLQTGEYYDARKELTGWDLPGYNDVNWNEVIEVHKCNGTKLKANKGPEVQIVLQKKAISVNKDLNEKYIYDIGQNMVGRVAFKLKCQCGDKVIFRFGEMLNQDGTLYTENLRSALQTDTYIAKGMLAGEEYEPRFTFHGFRYVEVSGLSYAPQLEDIVGKVIYSNCEITGKIETSNQMVNQLFSNQLWGQRGNFISIPTDCPQRDERMGWTGDAQIFAGTACYNMDCASFYEKYIEDCIEAQRPNGGITDVVPHVKWANGNDLVGHGNAAWGDVIFVIPWTLYNVYRNEKVLENAYPSMVKYMDYLEGTTTASLRPDSGYGDWLSIDDDTPKDVMSTAYYAYAANLTAKTAEVLGKAKAAAMYRNLCDEIKAAFYKAYIDKEGVIKGDTQCCYILALKMELLSGEDISKAVKHLIRTIKRKNWHLSTGFVGVSYLLPMLSEHGYNEVAYRLLLNDTYPSWGYSIKNGATTIWERWNSYTLENGFGDVGMNSFNHYSLGSVAEWMYRYMAGISCLAPGFRKIQLKPMPDNKLDFVSAEYNSIMGKIVSSWNIEAGKVVYRFIIPAGTTAQICIPDGDIMMEKGKSQAYEVVDGIRVYEAGSGEYIFVRLDKCRLR